MLIQPLASGSSGNMIYVASGATHILVDIGLNFKQTIARLKSAGIDPKEINAVLVTHEHRDHISGVADFLKKYPAYLYIHEIALECFLSYIPNIKPEQIHTFDDEFDIGDISVDFFPLPHDSEYCFGYSFSHNGCKVSMATDLGMMNEHIYQKMSGSQAVLLECNHDLIKLQNNVRYPWFLKKRIASNKGHLSNCACGLAVYKLALLGVEHIILAHLSQKNNTPTLAYKVVADFLASKGVIAGKDITMSVASQDEVGSVYEVKPFLVPAT
jgi:phosphoribosyl 1,2-cyclic phosphodiesterase